MRAAFEPENEHDTTHLANVLIQYDKCLRDGQHNSNMLSDLAPKVIESYLRVQTDIPHVADSWQYVSRYDDIFKEKFIGYSPCLVWNKPIELESGASVHALYLHDVII